MDVLFLATWFPRPPDNGYKLRVYHLLRALAQEHQVSLLSFAFDAARPDEPGELRAWCRDIQVVPINPFEANRASALHTFLSLRPMASRPIPAMSQLAADVLHTKPFDAIIASTEMMMDYVLWAPDSAAKVLEEHNAMTRWARERYLGATGFVQRMRCWMSWQKGRRYVAHSYRRFDLVTMVSEADRLSTIETLGAQRLRVETVPNGVDCTRNRPGWAKARTNLLVYNGSLTYSANYDAMRWFLAEIYPRIKQRVPSIALAITGSTQGVDTAALALDDSVTLAGYVADVRVPVAGATICIAPIRQGGGTRLKILEAMALGTPVVATSKGAEGLDVRDGEHLLLADDPQRFAERTVELLHDAALRARLAANARRLVEQHYDWDAIGRRFVALVEETVHNRRTLPLGVS